MRKAMALVVVVLCTPLILNAASEVVGGVTWYYETFASGGKTCAKIVSGNSTYTGELTIPASLGGYPVTSIGDDAFYFCDDLTKVAIPSSVTSIGEFAFIHCRRLVSVTIPVGVTTIGKYAFSDCWRLASVTIPAGVTAIGEGVFSDCRDLESVTIPSGVTSIEKLAFYRCTGLSFFEIPQSVNMIGSCAFKDCRSLKRVVVPWNCTFANDAFPMETCVVRPVGASVKGNDFRAVYDACEKHCGYEIVSDRAEYDVSKNMLWTLPIFYG